MRLGKSRWAVGSSNNIIGVCWARALAIRMRCFSPSECAMKGELREPSKSPLKGDLDPPCPSLKGRELFSPFKGELERVLKGDFLFSPFKGETEGVSD